MNESKSAFAAIVGKANVGKSSILNRLIGSKIAIVSGKPQTTRTKIMGVLTTDDNVQLVFTDTPGFFKPKDKLGEYMVEAVNDSISGVEECLFVVDATDKELNAAEKELINKFRSAKMPVITALNKIDMISRKEELISKIAALSEQYDFEAIVPVSAKTGEGIAELHARIAEQLQKTYAPVTFVLPFDRFGLVGQIRPLGRVVNEEYTDTGLELTVVLANADRDRLVSKYGKEILKG